MPNKEIILSIVIIVRNEQERIEKCLTCIIEQIDPQCMEVVLVDGDSTDNTLEIIEKFERITPYIQVIRCNRYGYSYQRNVGKNCAKGKYILYISGDTIASKGMLKKYMNVIHNYKYDVIQGTIINVSDNSKFGSYMKCIYPIFYKNVVGNMAHDVSTVNICIKRDLLEKYSFDERISSMEDKEWFVRLCVKEKDIKFRRLQSACIYHIVHENFWEYYKKIFREARALEKINKAYKKDYDTNFFNWIKYASCVMRMGILICLTMMILLICQQGKYSMVLFGLTFLVKSIYIILHYFRNKKCNFMYTLLISIYLNAVFWGYTSSKIERGLIKNKLFFRKEEQRKI